jgi:mannose-6-phosphate isomerase-like protein (cupin superfamily)
MGNFAENPGRRCFLGALPVITGAGLIFADAALFEKPAATQEMQASGAAGSFQLFTAETIQADIKALDASPGNNNLVTGKNFTVALTVEKAKSASEFEWHEARDHVLQILDGSTVIEVGGTPKNGHSIGPGEWRAPVSEGATALTLNKGDFLVIPRGTPHKRSTKGAVTLILISPQGTAA